MEAKQEMESRETLLVQRVSDLETATGAAAAAAKEDACALEAVTASLHAANEQLRAQESSLAELATMREACDMLRQDKLLLAKDVERQCVELTTAKVRTISLGCWLASYLQLTGLAAQSRECYTLPPWALARWLTRASAVALSWGWPPPCRMPLGTRLQHLPPKTA